MHSTYLNSQLYSEQRALFIAHSNGLAVVWRFVAGLTKMQNIGWNVIKENVKDYELSGDMDFFHRILFLSFYEAQDVQSWSSVFSQLNVHIRIVGLQSNYDSHALGYCICACSNSWSIDLSASGSGLEMLVHGMRSVEYGGGAIDKLKHSRFLYPDGVINKLESFLDLPSQILQTIKSLFLERSGIDIGGFDNLAKCIPHLSSLVALDVSDNPGGAGSLVKLMEALRRHGKLQTLLIDELEIGMEDVAALSQLIHPGSSLRELQVGVRDKTLPPMVMQHLVQAVLSPSSLMMLDYVESVSNS